MKAVRASPCEPAPCGHVRAIVNCFVEFGDDCSRGLPVARTHSPACIGGISFIRGEAASSSRALGVWRGRTVATPRAKQLQQQAVGRSSCRRSGPRFCGNRRPQTLAASRAEMSSSATAGTDVVANGQRRVLLHNCDCPSLAYGSGSGGVRCFQAECTNPLIGAHRHRARARSPQPRGEL